MLTLPRQSILCLGKTQGPGLAIMKSIILSLRRLGTCALMIYFVHYTVHQGLGNDFQVGGARVPPLKNHLPPNLNFSSDFGHFILKLFFTNKKLLKYFLVHFSVKVGGASPPPVSKLEGRLPLLPPPLFPGPCCALCTTRRL